MKTAGIIIFTIDLLKILYTGFNHVTTEKSVGWENPERVYDNQQRANWESYAGIGMMVLGSALLMFGRKKLFTT